MPTTPETNFNQDWISAPGDSIRDILEEQNKPIDWFARSMNFSAEEAEDLLQGKLAITTNIARSLEKVLGATASFWLRRDHQYRTKTRCL